MRKNNKRGFTLIEMMAVIAIIAVLVSILMPTFTGYKTKANAAANAANLRAVKATLSKMMIEGDITFSAAEETQKQIDDIVAQQAALDRTDWRQNIAWGLLEIDRLALRTVIVSNDKLNNTYYAKNEQMDVDTVIIHAPSSKAIKVDGLTLRAGTEMVATVGRDEVVLTYGGISLEVFAMIAENGDFSSIDMSKTEHAYVDSNDDDVCDLCDGKYPHGRGDILGGEFDEELGNVHSCSDVSPFDHKCDDKTCPNSVTGNCRDNENDGNHTCEADGCSNTASSCNASGENYSCTECGQPHTCSHGGWAGDGECAGCGNTNSWRNRCPVCN